MPQYKHYPPSYKYDINDAHYIHNIFIVHGESNCCPLSVIQELLIHRHIGRIPIISEPREVFDKILDMSDEEQAQLYRKHFYNNFVDYDYSHIEVSTVTDNLHIQKILDFAGINEEKKIFSLYLTNLDDLISVMFEDGSIIVNYFNTNYLKLNNLMYTDVEDPDVYFGYIV